MRVILEIASQPHNVPEDGRWDNLGNQDLTAQMAFHSVGYMLSHYVGIPEYDLDGVAELIVELHTTLKLCKNTSKVMANYVGNHEEYRIKLTA